MLDNSIEFFSSKRLLIFVTAADLLHYFNDKFIPYHTIKFPYNASINTALTFSHVQGRRG